MTFHTLKTNDIYWDAIADGSKNFELRRNDRDFSVGDVLILQRYDVLARCTQTGKTIVAHVGYILENAAEFGLEDGFCILGLDSIERV